VFVAAVRQQYVNNYPKERATWKEVRPKAGTIAGKGGSGEDVVS
jgi:hypothetical protein